MERDENGLSVLFPKSHATDRNDGGTPTGCQGAQLAMVYSPLQCWRMLYSPEKALMRGTMFEELDKPLENSEVR